MKKLLTILLALMMIYIMTNATTAEDLSGHIVYWSIWNETESNAQWMQNAMDSFSALYPNVTFDCVWNGRQNAAKVNAALASGQKIDIFDANSQVGYVTNSEYLIPVTKYFDQVYPTTNGKPYKDCVLPAFANMSRQIADSDELYMFCYAPSAYMFFYNREIFEDCGIEKTPDTWEEFMNVCQILLDKGYIPIATDDAYAYRLFGVYLTQLKGNEFVTDLVNSGLGEKWTNEGVVSAIKTMEKMVQKGYYKAGQAATPWPAVQQEMVIEGNIAMYYNGTWLPNEVADSAGTDFPWGQFAFPTLENAVYDSTYGGYASMGAYITKYCDCPDAAAAFLAYLTTGEYDSRYAVDCNGIPISIGGVWNAALTDAKAIFEGYKHWYLSGSMIASNSELLPVLKDCCVRLLSGTMTSEEFITVMSSK